MVIKKISDILPYKSSLGTRTLSSLKGVVVHHTASPISTPYNFMKRVTADANYHISKGWGHIAYHYMIDKDGNIYQCYSEKEIGAHAGDWIWNKNSIAVCMDGDFTKDALPPVMAQALKDFLFYLCFKRPDLPGIVKGTVKTHREVRPTPTACPSDKVQAIVNAFRL